jgi:hypothetical protein
MKTRKAYIKNLEYKFFSNFGKLYLTVDYDRNGEHNHYTFSNVPASLKGDKKSVRNFINN